MELTKDDLQYCELHAGCRHVHLDRKEWDEVFKNQELADKVNDDNMMLIHKNNYYQLKEDAEKLRRLDDIVKPHYEGMPHLLSKILNGEIELDFNARNRKIVERLKKRIEELGDDPYSPEIILKQELKEILDGDDT